MTVQSRLEDGDELCRLLVAIGQNRDPAAFKLLFELLAPRLRSFIGRRAAYEGTVDDVVQETFVNIWRKAHLYDPEKASAITWIYTVARNVRIDLIRKSARALIDVRDPVFVDEPIDTSLQKIAHARDKERLRRALSRLSTEQRDVMFLAFFADKPHSEVAKELGLPLGTVKSRIRLALQRLRQEFGEDS